MSIQTSPHSQFSRKVLLFILAGFAVLGAIIAADRLTETQPVHLDEAEQAFLLEREPIVVGIDQEFHPLQFADEDGPQGISVEYLAELASAAGLKLKLVPMLWSEAVDNLRSGSIDLMMDVTPTQDRSQFFSFSEPVGEHTVSLYVEDHVFGIESLSDLRGRRVGVLAETAIVDDVRAVPGIEIIEYELTADLINALLEGDIAAAAGYDYQFRYHLFKGGFSGVKTVGPPIHSEAGCFAVRHGDEVLLDILGKARAAVPDATRLRIEQQWVSTPSFTPGLKHLFRKYRHIAYVTIFALLAVALWNLLLQTRVSAQMRELRENEERYRALFENANDAIFLLRRGHTTDVNLRCTKLLGRTRMELIGHPFHKGAPPVQPDGTPSEDKARRFIRLAESGKPQTFRWTHLRADGREVHLEVSLNAFDTSEGVHVLAMCRDIADRMGYEAEILHRTEQFELLFKGSPLGIALIDEHGGVKRLNARFQELFGYSEQEVIGMDLSTSLIPPERRPEFDFLSQCIANGESGRIETQRLHRNGKLIDVEVFVHPIAPGGNFTGAFLLYNDISDRKTAEREMLLQKEHFRQLFENSPQAVAIVTPGESIVEINQGFEELFGYTQQEAAGRKLADLIVPAPLINEHENLADEVASGATTNAETIRRRKDGSTVPVELLAYPIFTDGELTGGYCIYKNITKRREAEEKLVHQAYHDRLTGLPNRAMLLDRIGQAIRRAKRTGNSPFALLFLDIDRFKVVNDSLGHSVGDQIIKATAKRLEEALGDGDSISRVGGDEFAILLEGIITPEKAISAVHRLQSCLRRPFTIGGQDIHTTSSVGLVQGPPEHLSPEGMLRDAEIAVHQAKDMGKDSLVVFQPSMHDHAVRILTLESELRQAIDQGQLETFYQPIVNLSSGHPAGFEALVRWRHPERGLVPPDEFIPLAEETKLIIPLGAQVLQQACRDFMSWRTARSDLPLEFMTVNLSARQFTHQDLLKDIRAALTNTGMPAQALHLEITESVVMENAHAAERLLGELKKLGVHLSIDDFGTGYSSLSYLHSLPVDTLKVDRSFVARMTPGDGHEEIVRTIIQLAHNLGMTVVAEGVETVEQEGQLHRMRCDLGQGYLWSKPLPGSDAYAFLKAWPNRI